MDVFRLVNENFSETVVGEFIGSVSTMSNMKLGVGLYVCESKSGADAFLTSHHGHTYTHLLKLQLQGLGAGDFLDWEVEAKHFDKFSETWQWAPASRFVGALAVRGKASLWARYADYVASKAAKGIKWESRSGWVEFVIHEPHWQNAALIVESSRLAPAADSTGDGR